MEDKVFEILGQVPWLTILMSFLLAGFIAWLLRAQIVAWVKRRYNLYDENEVHEAVHALYGDTLAGSIGEELQFNRKIR